MTTMNGAERAPGKTITAAGNALAGYLIFKAVKGAWGEAAEARRDQRYIDTVLIDMAVMLRNRALESGRSHDKLIALEAANSASKTNKGRNLGRETLSMFIDQYQRESPYFGEIRPFDETLPDGNKKYGWISAELARKLSAVGEAIGGEGITMEKPETLEEYYETSCRLSDFPAQRSRLAEIAMEYGDYFVVEDFSVPGTLFQLDAATFLF